MIRGRGPRSDVTTTRSLPPVDHPIIMRRSSPGPCRRSTLIQRSGSPVTLRASTNEIPCFWTLDRSFQDPSCTATQRDGSHEPLPGPYGMLTAATSQLTDEQRRIVCRRHKAAPVSLEPPLGKTQVAERSRDRYIRFKLGSRSVSVWTRDSPGDSFMGYSPSRRGGCNRLVEAESKVMVSHTFATCTLCG